MGDEDSSGGVVREGDKSVFFIGFVFCGCTGMFVCDVIALGEFVIAFCMGLNVGEICKCV